MSEVLLYMVWVLGGVAVSYEQGTPVHDVGPGGTADSYERGSPAGRRVTERALAQSILATFSTDGPCGHTVVLGWGAVSYEQGVPCTVQD